jgi:hypothetical protein
VAGPDEGVEKWQKSDENGVENWPKSGRFLTKMGSILGQFWSISGLLEGVEKADFGRFCEFLRIICAPGVRPQYPPGDIGTPPPGVGGQDLREAGDWSWGTGRTSWRGGLRDVRSRVWRGGEI